MAWHRQGTVAVTNNSATVTGTNAAFAANVRVGDSFIGPDGKNYEVVNVASDTVLSIAPVYAGPTASNMAYGIMPVQGYPKLLVDTFNTIIQANGTKLTALKTTGNYDVLPIEKGGTSRSDGRALMSELGVNQSPALFNMQGMFMGWNALGTGEANFVCNQGGGTGGFTWRSVNQSNTASGPTMSYSYAGILSVPQLSVTASPIAIASGGTSATTAAAARTNLGLGSVAIENVTPVAKGGTGATTAADARTALGFVAGQSITLGSMEIIGATPYLDFHFNSTTADFDVRVMNDAAGVLGVYGKLAANGFFCRTGLNGARQSATYNFNWTGSYVDVYIDATYIGSMTLFQSDYRLKKYIKDFTVDSFLDRIEAYRIVTYQRKNFGDVFKGGDTVFQGLIAHEAQAVNPLAASGEKDGVDDNGNARIQQLDPMALITDLMGAVKELNAQVKQLRLELDATKQ